MERTDGPPAADSPPAADDAAAKAAAEAKSKADGKAEPAKGAPDQYQPYTLPEGLTLSDTAIAKANETFKGIGLTQEQAQSIVALHADQVKAITDEITKTYTTMRDGWRGEVLKDTTLAANGDLKPEVKAAISKAIDTLGPEQAKAVRAAMDLTGAGDHPAMVRAMVAFAEKLTEGTSVTGKGPAAPGQRPNGATKPSPAQAMFPNLPSSNA